jgi:hypothetical protein
MSLETARSLHSRSTSQREDRLPSRATPATDFYDAPPAPDKGDSQCRCGRLFTPKLPRQTQCARCRQHQLILDGRRGDKREVDALYALLEEEYSHIGDWKLLDENGDETWATDLAKRYRQQTRPRPVRGQLSSWR